MVLRCRVFVVRVFGVGHNILRFIFSSMKLLGASWRVLCGGTLACKVGHQLCLRAGGVASLPELLQKRVVMLGNGWDAHGRHHRRRFLKWPFRQRFLSSWEANQQIYANLKNGWIEQKPSEICSLLVIQKIGDPLMEASGQLLAKMMLKCKIAVAVTFKTLETRQKTLFWAAVSQTVETSLENPQ